MAREATGLVRQPESPARDQATVAARNRQGQRSSKARSCCGVLFGYGDKQNRQSGRPGKETTMNFMTKLATIAVIGGSASSAHAQTAEQIFQAAINADGKSCAEVTAMNPIAALDTGGAVIGVACSGGEQYAVTLSADAEVTGVQRCSTFEGVTGTSCF